MSESISGGAGATNPALHAAVEAFAAEPSATTSLDVLRYCLHGPLLLDITGSQIEHTDDGAIGPGSSISIRGGQGPDGRPALLAFTSHAELARMYADESGTTPQSLVQAGADVLAMAAGEEQPGWVYVDPAGPTCALSPEDIDFALRIPRNDAVRAALEPDVPREQLLAALRADDSPLVLAVVTDLPAGEVVNQASVQVRTTEAPGGGTALLAFTSGPEASARAAGDGVVAQPAADVVAMVLGGGHAGLVLNAAGPWAFLTADELRSGS